MTIEGPRVLEKVFDSTDILCGPSQPFPATIDGGDWEILENLVAPTYAVRGYYDLSGYNRKHLTSFFQGIDIQEGFGPQGTANFWITEMITTEHVDDATLIEARPTDRTGDFPGFPRSTFDMSQVIYGRTRLFVAATGSTIANQYSVATWGTCSATTADKVHLTRVVYVDYQAAVDSRIRIPAADYVSAIIVAEEKELAFLMRQKRSYELATGP